MPRLSERRPGAVAGLVAITPCAGFVGGLAPVVIGLAAGVVCYLAISLKFRFGYDDSLEVVAVQPRGRRARIDSARFLRRCLRERGRHRWRFLRGGGGSNSANKCWRVVASGVSFVVSGLIGIVLRAAPARGIPWASDEEEITGLDLTQHSETAYSL